MSADLWGGSGGVGGGQLFMDSVAFSLGLATTLAILGIGASLAGKAYGQIGQGLPIAVSCVAMIMGLNLLEVGQSFIHYPSIPEGQYFSELIRKQGRRWFLEITKEYTAQGCMMFRNLFAMRIIGF